MSEERIDISVVLPCLNEEDSIGICIKKVKDVLSKENMQGEIIVVDNGSTDSSVDIAKGLGAKIIHQPIRGYGAAYLKGLEQVKGKYIVIADADDTYDLYDISKFIVLLKGGCDFVIGNRFKGKIYKKSMPLLNRYVGNPVLSGLCKLFFRTKLSDIHCGMRAFTKEAYERMNLKCLGMEFATEMVMEALQRRLRIKELPLDYHPRRGKSKLRPFSDAWRHLRFMLLFCPTWLYFVPGLSITIFGLFTLFLLVKGPFMFLGHSWDIHMMILSSLLGILGYQLINLGMYAKTFAVQQGYLVSDRTINFFARHFRLETGILLGAILFIIGLAVNLNIFIEWWQSSFGSLYRIREAILAMTFMILGIQTIFSSFFISLLIIKR